jgi:hypothetical protein
MLMFFLLLDQYDVQYLHSFSTLNPQKDVTSGTIPPLHIPSQSLPLLDPSTIQLRFWLHQAATV